MSLVSGPLTFVGKDYRKIGGDSFHDTSSFGSTIARLKPCLWIARIILGIVAAVCAMAKRNNVFRHSARTLRVAQGNPVIISQGPPQSFLIATDGTGMMPVGQHELSISKGKCIRKVLFPGAAPRGNKTDGRKIGTAPCNQSLWVFLVTQSTCLQNFLMMLFPLVTVSLAYSCRIAQKFCALCRTVMFGICCIPCTGLGSQVFAISLTLATCFSGSFLFMTLIRRKVFDFVTHFTPRQHTISLASIGRKGIPIFDMVTFCTALRR